MPAGHAHSASLVVGTSLAWIFFYWVALAPPKQFAHTWDVGYKNSTRLDDSRKVTQLLPTRGQRADSSAWSRGPSIGAHADNLLYQYFLNKTSGPLIHKWLPYFDVYDRYFARFRNRPVRFLEIGVQSGGTIGMWKHYFGESLKFYGIDINPYCKALFGDQPQVTIFTGDQGSAQFWAEMQARKLVFDVILDDGGHTMSQQIMTFEKAWGMLADGGVWITEDTATSYDLAMGQGSSVNSGAFEGGYGKNSTWMEYVKRNLVDPVNGHYILQNLHPSFDTSRLRDSILSVAAYDQMVVFEKGRHPRPAAQKRGNFVIPYNLAAKQVRPELLAEYQATMDKVGRV